MRCSLGLAVTACVAVGSILSGGAHAATMPAGSLHQTYDWGAFAFLSHPTQPVVYASVPDRNAVAIINTDTLAATTVPVGAFPMGMALSPDGSRLYVADGASNFVRVVDTASGTALPPIQVPTTPYDVEFGNGNRLFVLGNNGIHQVDATSGNAAGPTMTTNWYGSLEISPDRNTLYYGQGSLSPSRLYKFDVTTNTPPAPTSIVTGSNGQDLALSRDGSFIAHANGSPYHVAIYRTSDMAQLGALNTGPYPSEVVFSPGDDVAYVVHTSGQIDLFDTQSFMQTDTFTVATGEVTELGIDRTGRYLFASWGGTTTRVYDTGRAALIVPEPGSVGLVVLPCAAALLARRRRVG